VGYLIVVTVGIPEGEMFGLGPEPWNLPGTILGIAAWILIVRWQLRRQKTSRITAGIAITKSVD
jgi:hypothetical protein